MIYNGMIESNEINSSILMLFIILGGYYVRIWRMYFERWLGIFWWSIESGWFFELLSWFWFDVCYGNGICLFVLRCGCNENFDGWIIRNCVGSYGGVSNVCVCCVCM